MTRNVGTPLYLAPEMYEEGNYTNLIDVYSFSLILYEILVKRTVFPENIQPAPLMRRVISGTRAEIPESIRPEIREIIERCWAVNPEERFTFDQIYQKLKDIDFKITPNVDSDQVKSYINEIEPNVDINIRLWNGELYPMNVSIYDRLYDIRKRISEHTNIELKKIIPCNGYRPLYCCWNHTLGDGTFFYEIYNRLYRDNLQQNGIIIELGIKIRLFGDPSGDKYLLN